MPTPDAVLTRAARGVALVAGLTLLLVGLGLAVLLGPDGAWSATATVPAGRAAVLLEPSVVSVLGPRVAVTAEAVDGRPLFVGRARSDDADGYVRGTAHARVAGAGADRRLDVVPVAGTQRLVAPQDSDVWQQSGTGRLTWAPTRGAQSVVVVRADGRPLPGLALTVTWHRGGWIWGPVVLILVGGLLALLPRLLPRLVSLGSLGTARPRRQPTAAPTLDAVDA